MSKNIPSILLSSLCLFLASQSQAQNACPSQASFDQNGSPIEDTFTGVETGDLNGDGHLDALWLDPTNGSIIVDYGNGNGSFFDSKIYQIPNSGSAAVGDMNGDGHPDLVVHDTSLDAMVIYETDGEGNLNDAEALPVQGTGPLEVAISLYDLDGDEKLDIISSIGSLSCVGVRLAVNGFDNRTCLINNNSGGKLVPVDLNGPNNSAKEFVQSGTGLVFSWSGTAFTQERDLGAESGLTNVGSVFPKDVDGDGDVDIQISGEDVNGPVVINFINHRVTQCNDELDNDNDGQVDLNDFGCSSLRDLDESTPSQATECSDGEDNDEDGAVDTNDTACVIPGNMKEDSTTCGGKTELEFQAAGNFTLNTVGASNDLSVTCGGGLF